MGETNEAQGTVTFGRRIWEYRRRAGLTQEQLGRIIGYTSNNQIIDIEADRRVPDSRARYLKLRDYLCRSTEEEEELNHLYLPKSESVGFHEFRVQESVIDFIHHIYASLIADAHGELVRIGDTKYPVAFFPANGAPIETLLPQANMDARASVAVSTAAHDKFLAIRQPAYRKAQNDHLPEGRRRSEVGQTDGWNIRMTSLAVDETNGHPITHARVCEYGSILDSCDCLRDELVWLAEGKYTDGISKQQYDEVWRQLPLRQHAHAAEEGRNPLLSAEKRAAGFGLSGVIVFKRDDGRYYALFGKRSAKVGTYQRGEAVVPSGMSNWRFTGKPQADAAPDGTDIQPYGSYIDTYFYLALLDEYAEEAGGRGQVSDIRGNPDDVLNDPFVQRLLHTHKAEIHYTGLAYDLLCLRPEVCFLIIIDDVAWFNTTEYEHKVVLADDEYDKDGGLGYEPIDDIPKCVNKLTQRRTLPPSAAAFKYGIELAKRLRP